MQKVIAIMLVKALFFCNWFSCGNQQCNPSRREICNLICVSNATIYLIGWFIYFCFQSLPVFYVLLLDTMAVKEKVRCKKTICQSILANAMFVVTLDFVAIFEPKKASKRYYVNYICHDPIKQVLKCNISHQEFSCN